jgi:hypothetical protein
LIPKRKVENNIFYSTFPDIQVKIKSNFKYIGKLKRLHTQEGIEVKLSGSSDSFPFIEHEGPVVKKAIILQIEKTSGYYIGDCYRGMEKSH